MNKVFREDLEKQSKKKVLQTDIKAIEKHFMHNFSNKVTKLTSKKALQIEVLF